MPALYALMVRRLLPVRFSIVGVARTEGDNDSWRAEMEQAVKEHARDEFRQDVWDELADAMRYIATDFADEGGEDRLEEVIAACEEEKDLGGNRVYYLAVPPPAFPTIVDALGKRKDDRGWTRVIVEKPFGHDLASARALNELLWQHFDEREVPRHQAGDPAEVEEDLRRRVPAQRRVAAALHPDDDPVDAQADRDDPEEDPADHLERRAVTPPHQPVAAGRGVRVVDGRHLSSGLGDGGREPV